MSQPIKHHHVPQLYLKNFTCNSRGQLYVYSKKKRDTFKANIKDVCAERNFYTLNVLGDNKMAVEKFYATGIEPDMAKVISEIKAKSDICLLRSGVYVLDDKTKGEIASFMANQSLRGKNTREYQNKNSKEIFPVVIERAKKKFSKEEIDNFLNKYVEDENLQKYVVVASSLDASLISNIIKALLQKKWVIYKVVGDLEFVSSDNPVIVLNNKTSSSKPFENGIAQKETSIFYPLTSKILVAIYTEFYMSSFEGQIIFIDSQVNKSFIKEMNNMQLLNCHSQAFSSSEKYLKM